MQANLELAEKLMNEAYDGFITTNNKQLQLYALHEVILR